jgi:2-methylcitrate dehydratase
VFFRDGSSTERVEVSYPIGHRRRRGEGIPLLVDKFRGAVAAHFGTARAEEIGDLCSCQGELEKMPVPDFVDEWVK